MTKLRTTAATCLLSLLGLSGCAAVMEGRSHRANECANAKIEEIDKTCKGVDSVECAHAYRQAGIDCREKEGVWGN